MKTEIVISPILDEKIHDHLSDSPIWTKSFTKDEVDDELRKNFPILYSYSIKFDGLKPVQCTKIDAI